jgi:tRNA G18 (ribose-2'-O)-methylase SpoU
MAAPTTRTQQIGSGHPDVRRALAVKRGREPGRLLIDGVWAHRAALAAGAEIESHFVVPELLHSAEALALADRCRVSARDTHQVSTKIIERLSERDRCDGLASIIVLPSWHADRLRLPSDALVVVADGLQSPGNLGTVIRTIDACRADLLIMTNLRARPTSDLVFRGSRGLSLMVPQLIMEDPDQAIEWLTGHSVSIMVADADDGVPYPQADLRGPTALVLGNERYGPAAEWRRFPRLRIPMLGTADSLNVAVSAGVLLYHARAQRENW